MSVAPRRRTLGVLGALAVVTLIVLGSAPAAPQPVSLAGDETPAARALQSSVDGEDESGARPLVVVLDTSGSMAEDDGTGTIKLAGAQAALSRVIREQRPGSQIGLWTYPDSTCGPGDFRIPVQDLDQRSMIASIRSLTADGDTPTGEALRATVDNLVSNGYGGATILLISDGLHTCDADPCRVAEEVVAEGFDLTVQAAGFQIDEEGADELACIAGATGGSVSNATDADDLTEVVADAARAELTMEVTGLPSQTPAGSASRVTVEVTNESAVDVTDARISFSFGGTFNQGVIPAALPPLERLGNLRAGSSTAYTWLVSYGSQGKTGTAAYRIAAWGSNAQPRTATGVVRVTDEDLTFDDAGGYVAGLEGARIAILGDSYSSGEGAGDYLTGTDQDPLFGKNRCHKSPHTYLYPLFDKSDVELIACSGATTHHLGDDPASGVREEQVPLLEERQRDAGPVEAAFMTIGGNDVTFGDLITTCLKFGDCSDDTAFTDQVQRLVDGLGAELRPTYRDVYQALNDRGAVRDRGHLAPLYILAYPQPFPERQWAGSFCRGFEADEIAWSNDLVDSLNAEIEKAVDASRREGYHVRFISTVQEAFLPDNTACPRPGAKPSINPVDLASGVGAKADQFVRGVNYVHEFMHPNVDGYRSETNVILAWSVDEDESLPKGVREWRDGQDDGLLDLDYSSLARAITPSVPTHSTVAFDASTASFADPDSIDVRAGQSVMIRAKNAMPGSTVTISMASRARVVGLLVVGEDGVARGTVRIPSKAAMGTHHLTVLAVNDQGHAVTGSHELDVSRAIPLWATPVLVGTVLCLVGWVLCRAWHRRLTRRLVAAARAT